MVRLIYFLGAVEGQPNRHFQDTKELGKGRSNWVQRNQHLNVRLFGMENRTNFLSTEYVTYAHKKKIPVLWNLDLHDAEQVTREAENSFESLNVVMSVACETRNLFLGRSARPYVEPGVFIAVTVPSSGMSGRRRSGLPLNQSTIITQSDPRICVGRPEIDIWSLPHETNDGSDTDYEMANTTPDFHLETWSLYLHQVFETCDMRWWHSSSIDAFV